METQFEGRSSRIEMVVDGRADLHHKTPPRIPPKPTSRSPTPTAFVGKITRQQSPSPVRHVRAPAPSPVR